MVARTNEALQNVAFPFTVVEYTTVDEFLDAAANRIIQTLLVYTVWK